MSAMKTGRTVPERLAMYSMAFGAMGVSAGTLAAPVVIPALGSMEVDNTSDTFAVDVNGDLTDDFTFSVSDNGNDTYYSYIQGTQAENKIFVEYFDDPPVYCGNYYYAGLIAAGTDVGPALGGDDPTSPDPGFSNFAYFSVANSPGEECGFFTRGTRGFIGFKFEVAGNTHYGYLDVELREGSTIVEVFGGAYESQADTPILIPLSQHEVTPVPVGGAIPAALGLLALGAAALRRRKSAAH